MVSSGEAGRQTGRSWRCSQCCQVPNAQLEKALTLYCAPSTRSQKSLTVLQLNWGRGPQWRRLQHSGTQCKWRVVTLAALVHAQQPVSKCAAPPEGTYPTH